MYIFDIFLIVIVVGLNLLLYFVSYCFNLIDLIVFRVYFGFKVIGSNCYVF